MLRFAPPSRSVLSLCVLSLLAPTLGLDCMSLTPMSGLWGAAPIQVSIVSDWYFDVDQTASAAALVTGASGTVTYEWSVNSPAVIVGTGDGQVTNFMAAEPCSVILLVTVTDSGTRTSVTNGMAIEFQDYGSPTTQPAEPLTIDAGPDRTVAVGYTTLPLGSVSGGSGYHGVVWRQASGPVQTVLPADGVYSDVVTVVGTTPGTAVFEMIVRDSGGYTSNSNTYYEPLIVTDTVAILVTSK